MAVWPHGSRPLLAPAVLSVRGAEPGGAAPTYTGIRPECRSFSIRGAVKLGINKHVFIAGVDHRILLACIFVPLTSVRSQVPGRCPLWGLGRNSIQMAFWGLSSRSSPPVQGSVRGHVRVCRPIPPPPPGGVPCTPGVVLPRSGGSEGWDWAAPCPGPQRGAVQQLRSESGRGRRLLQERGLRSQGHGGAACLAPTQAFPAVHVLPHGDSGTQAPSSSWPHCPLDPQGHLLSSEWGRIQSVAGFTWIFMKAL